MLVEAAVSLQSSGNADLRRRYVPPYPSKQNDGPHYVPILFAEEIRQKTGAPIVSYILFFLVFRTDEVMNMVAEFVIKHRSQAYCSSEREPQECPRVKCRNSPVYTDLDPRSFATPLRMVSTQNV